jgi:hypothetical protein
MDQAAFFMPLLRSGRPEFCQASFIMDMGNKNQRNYKELLEKENVVSSVEHFSNLDNYILQKLRDLP